MLIAHREGARGEWRLGTAEREADADPMREEGIPLDLATGGVRIGCRQRRGEAPRLEGCQPCSSGRRQSRLQRWSEIRTRRALYTTTGSLSTSCSGPGRSASFQTSFDLISQAFD